MIQNRDDRNNLQLIWIIEKKHVLLQAFSKKAKMKNIYTLLLFIAFSANVNAQVQTAEASSADSLINVITFFCKTDTMDYRVEELQHKFMTMIRP